MLPARGTVAGDDGGHLLRGVEDGLVVTVGVEADAGQSRRGALLVEAAGLQDAGCEAHHAAVEGEAGVGGGLVGQVVQTLLHAGRHLCPGTPQRQAEGKAGDDHTQ
jgi:hypothetical protein